MATTTTSSTTATTATTGTTSTTQTDGTSTTSTTSTTGTKATTSTKNTLPTTLPTGAPKRPSDIHSGKHGQQARDSGPSAGWAVLAVMLFVIAAFFGWWAYRYFRARRMGLPAPPLNPFSGQEAISRNYPAQGGVIGWIKGLKNRRSATGAYEGNTSGAGFGGVGRRGTGQPLNRALDPDEAWDARVGVEADDFYDVRHGRNSSVNVPGGAGAYYEEQELGLRDRPSGDYGGRGYGPVGGPGDVELEERGRRGRSELDARFEDEMRSGRSRGQDPFGDSAEPSNLSMRGVSPRPYDGSGDDGHGARSGHKTGPSADDSPTERRSMFKEEV